MDMPLQPRWVYTDSVGAVDFHMRVPQRAWSVATSTIGGSDESAAGVPAAFRLLQKYPWHLTLRFQEREWPSVERLVAHLQGAGSATFYPDRLKPESSTVYGVSPAMGEDVSPRRSDEPSTLELDIVIRPTTPTVVRAKYYDRALWRYSAGDDARHITFTRPGAVGGFEGYNRLLQQAAENQLRTTWKMQNGVLRPYARLEGPAYTNLVTPDDVTAWTDVGTPVITSSVSDPAGGTAAYRIADDSGAAAEYKARTVAFTGDAIKSLVFVVREATMATSGVQILRLRDDTAVAERLVLEISAWVAGAPTVSATTGTYLGKLYVGDGYWAIYGQSTSVTAANTNVVHVLPAATSAATGSIDVYRVNAYNAEVPPFSVLSASAVKGAEAFSDSFPYTPQQLAAMGGATLYVDFIEGMYPNWATEGGVPTVLAGASNAGLTGAYLLLYRVTSSDSYRIDHTNVSTVGSAVDLNPTRGDRIQLAAQFNKDGSVRLIGRKNGGSDTTGSTSSAVTPASSFGAGTGQTIRLGGVGTFGRGIQDYADAIVFPGVLDIDESEREARAA